MRDNRFLKTIQRVGRDGTTVFTTNQLYSAYLDNSSSSKVPAIIVAAILFFIGCVNASSIPSGLLLIVLAVFLLVAAFRHALTPRSQFDHGIRTWTDHGRKIEGLIHVPTLDVPPEAWPEEDIYDYGVERILIVQRPILVDLLVKNCQHAEQRMLVISESGYPTYLQDRTNQLLAERAELSVYLLHDADEAGVGMAERVKNLEWLELAGNEVVDLGFFESDFESLSRTKKYRRGTKSTDLPVDAIRMVSLALGLSQCFANQSTFAMELHREQQNEMAAGSSFG